MKKEYHSSSTDRSGPFLVTNKISLFQNFQIANTNKNKYGSSSANSKSPGQI